MGFDAGIGLSEMVIIGVVALLVVGPKDLPLMMRKVGGWIRKMRAMASDFQSSFDELARQSELDELRKELDELRELNPINKVQDEINSVFETKSETPTSDVPLTFNDVNSEDAIRHQEDFAANKAKEQIAKAKRKAPTKVIPKVAKANAAKPYAAKPKKTKETA